MQFTRLRLTGFKSFVDPTDLVIADGLTGVVGPNGCGKSNLLEALRWVMGENRPTAMRGGGMEDVIFAGAATRPARSFAEVAIHIDNSDRLAPAAFNMHDQLDITRRITRDVGSAFKVNTREVRARDVQMLFADASTGAHSPALVRQGQIAELINAKPKARRRILEEAAGISGLYQRRHEAELKLKAAEANLARVDDVIEQLATQLSALARQAKQAARYREIGAALRAAEGRLLYRRWSEAEAARAAAADVLRKQTGAAAQAEAAARAAAKGREAADAALPALREEEAIAGAVLQRLEVQRNTLDAQETSARERVETLRSRIEQLSHDMTRETGLNRDAGETIARLEDEAQELDAASAGHEAALEEAAKAAQAAAAAVQARESDMSAQTEEVARLAAQHQAAERRLADGRTTLERAENEAGRVRDALAQSRAALEAAGRDHAAAQTAEADAARAAAQVEAALAAAETARAEAQSKEAEARARRAEAEGEVAALGSEVTALARLVERDTVEGGQIIDALTVGKGYEPALGAALADDLRAPEAGADGASGWALLPRYPAPPPLPQGVAALSDHVGAPPVLARRMGQVGLVDAEEGPRLQPLLQPGQRLVSIAGDLWRWDGFRTRAEDAPNAAALRLEQVNRLEDLRQHLARATERAEGARRAHEMLNDELAAAAEADTQARAARRAADTARNDAARTLSRAEADRTRAQSELDSLDHALARHEQEAATARRERDSAAAARAELPDLDAARAAAESLRQAVGAARGTLMTRRAAHEELQRAGEARARRAQAVAREIAGWRDRLATAESRAAELERRRAAAQAELDEASPVPQALQAQRTELAGAIDTAQARRAAATEALSAGEAAARAAVAAERDAERTASEMREARARAEAQADAAAEAAAQAAARIADTQDLTPDALLAQLGVDPDDIPGAQEIEADVTRLKRQRDALGAVNLRAEEDAVEVQQEHDGLLAEKTDLEEAIRTLRAGIASLNREGRERLLTAFEQVNGNFSMLFRHLFGGGEANLVMVESDDPLDAGLEIMCQPPGKKLAVLSLLSGGEQTLTALALIFAVFLANPAPICVLDEVDAPLDDANVSRFCDLLDEMCRRTDTRFLIITHHAVTMSRMDRLFGVTMAEQGVSQLVSVDLRKAEQMVA